LTQPASSSTIPGFVNIIDGKVSESHFSLHAGTTVTWDYSFTNGEDLSSEVSGGFNDVVVLLVTDPLGNKQSILSMRQKPSSRRRHRTAPSVTPPPWMEATPSNGWS
jgi:hypothetical protein